MAKSQEKPEKERPNLSLLSVNDQFNKEATPILYSKADFNINTPANYTRFMQNSASGESRIERIIPCTADRLHSGVAEVQPP